MNHPYYPNPQKKFRRIKATFQDRFLRFWYYEGTDLIYKFEEN